MNAKNCFYGSLNLNGFVKSHACSLLDMFVAGLKSSEIWDCLADFSGLREKSNFIHTRLIESHNGCSRSIVVTDQQLRCAGELTKNIEFFIFWFFVRLLVVGSCLAQHFSLQAPSFAFCLSVGWRSVCWCLQSLYSTSRPGVNQVDGLPPASHRVTRTEGISPWKSNDS